MPLTWAHPDGATGTFRDRVSELVPCLAHVRIAAGVFPHAPLGRFCVLHQFMQHVAKTVRSRHPKVLRVTVEPDWTGTTEWEFRLRVMWVDDTLDAWLEARSDAR